MIKLITERQYNEAIMAMTKANNAIDILQANNKKLEKQNADLKEKIISFSEDLEKEVDEYVKLKSKTNELYEEGYKKGYKDAITNSGR